MRKTEIKYWFDEKMDGPNLDNSIFFFHSPFFFLSYFFLGLVFLLVFHF